MLTNWLKIIRVGAPYPTKMEQYNSHNLTETCTLWMAFRRAARLWTGMPNPRPRWTKCRTREAACRACLTQHDGLLCQIYLPIPSTLIIIANSISFLNLFRERECIIPSNHHRVIELCSFYPGFILASQAERTLCINVLIEVYSSHFLKLCFVGQLYWSAKAQNNCEILHTHSRAHTHTHTPNGTKEMIKIC